MVLDLSFKTFINFFTLDESLSCQQSISSIIEWNLPIHIIPELNVKNMVVKSRWIVRITWKRLQISKSLCLLLGSIGIHYLTNVFPYFVHNFPHVSTRYTFLFENLDFSFFFACNLALLTHVWRIIVL